MGNTEYTGLLYSQPSFTEGLARVLDVGGTFDMYNYSATAEEADRLAIASDWYAIGADLYRAICRFRKRVGRGSEHGKTVQSSR